MQENDESGVLKTCALRALNQFFQAAAKLLRTKHYDAKARCPAERRSSSSGADSSPVVRAPSNTEGLHGASSYRTSELEHSGIDEVFNSIDETQTGHNAIQSSIRHVAVSAVASIVRQ